jgi:hypothetical protein
MTKVERLKLATARKEFEAWVNNPFMTDESTRPDSWCPCSKRDLEEWELAPYDHPWTNGAWEVWKKFNNLPNDPDQEEEDE